MKPRSPWFRNDVPAAPLDPDETSVADFHIPDALPSDLDLPSRSVVPLFALPSVCLFPGTVVPLHIFEDRYKQMIEDLLDGPGRFVVGTVAPGHEAELRGSPPVHEIGGLGEIGRHERLPNGRFLILVLGLKRVRLREVESERLYRRVEIEPLEELLPTDDRQDELRGRLVEVLGGQLDQNLKSQPSGKELPLQSLPLPQLTDLLILHLRLPQERLLEVFSETDVARRAEAALQAQRELGPIDPPDSEPDFGEGPLGEGGES